MIVAYLDSLFDSLALAGSPVQWVIAGLIAVAIFAPRLLPPLARMFGHQFKREARRRLGLPDEPPARPRARQPEIEALPPEPVRTAAPVAETPRYSPPPRPSSMRTTWTISAIVAAAVAGLLWYLLHAR